VIKAQRYRSQEQNKLDALQRLIRLIKKVNTTHKKRKKTKPSKQSIKKRVDSKVQRGKLKKLRQSL
jgi:ribosome-associated protein